MGIDGIVNLKPEGFPMERRVFICPTCGAVKVVEQRVDQHRADYFNRLPAQIPCETTGCEDYAKPVEGSNAS